MVLSLLAERDNTTGEVSNRRLAIGKHRDGEEGPLTGFELPFISLGENEYGDEFGSCAIEPCEAAKTQRPARQSRGGRAIDDAFNEIAANGTIKHFVRNDGPQCEAVKLDEVEIEFKRRYPTDKGDEKQKAGARKKAWQRARAEALKTGGGYGYEERAGVQLIWRI